MSTHKQRQYKEKLDKAGIDAIDKLIYLRDHAELETTQLQASKELALRSFGAPKKYISDPTPELFSLPHAEALAVIAARTMEGHMAIDDATFIVGLLEMRQVNMVEELRGQIALLSRQIESIAQSGAKVIEHVKMPEPGFDWS